MIKISHPTKALKGNVALPASKSISNRVLLIQALCNNAIEITNLSAAQDTVVMQQALQSTNGTIDVGDAGTAMRFLLAFYSIQPKQTILTGSARMQQRPIGPLVDALRQMGADITYLGTEGYPPVSITGNTNLKPVVSISGSVSSQYLSALMMIGPRLANGLEITIEGVPTSYSYLEMTQAVMEHFGAEVTLNTQSITISPQPYTGGSVEIEADWSAASYFFEMVALAKKADVVLDKLPYYSIQGDSAIAALYEAVFSVRVDGLENGVRLRKESHAPTNVAEYDFTLLPDMAQTVAATTAALGLSFSLTGLQTLSIKETDRITALKTELEKIGAEIEVGPDWLKVKANQSSNQNLRFSTYNDHRMAMALAPLALIAHAVVIDDEAVVAKSFPQYWVELEKLGFVIEQI
jgi:3-phosphoshikimate 1-carboxyvinyltransferase